MSGRVHVLGAGLAGLSAAVRLLENGVRVTVHEAAGHAGGRCRSFYHDGLGKMIDNGNHLVLSGNDAVAGYLKTIGGDAAVRIDGPARFPFLDLKTGERWTLQPDAGAVPWSIFSTRGRVPGASLGDYLKSVRILGAGADDSVADRIATTGPLWDRFWAPLIVSIMNTRPEAAAAEVMARVLKLTFGRGERSCRPLFVPAGLGAAFVDPAVQFIEARGGDIRFNDRVRQVDIAGQRVVGLVATSGPVDMGPDDRIVLALPAPVAAGLMPSLQAPDAFSAIVNGHFALPDGTVVDETFLGLIHGTAEWLFVRDGVVSVTVSAADALVGQSADDIAVRMWADITAAFSLGEAALPVFEIVKEKRATFLQTPAQMRKRPTCRTEWRNLVLAGDWTDTGLPATIEGAVRSGFRAAGIVMKMDTMV